MPGNNERESSIVGPIRTPEGKLAFPHLLQIESTGQYPSNKFVTTFLMLKTLDMTALVNACVQAAQKEWPTLGIQTPNQIQLPIRKGVDKDAEWADYLFFKAKSSTKPQIVDSRKEPWTGTPRGGDICKLAVSALPYKQTIQAEVAEALRAQGRIVQSGVIDGRPQNWRPAVTFLLNAVQFLRAGERSGVDGTQAFAQEAPAAAAGSAASDLFN